MKILKIKNILKKDIPLHYRNEFSGTVVYEAANNKQEEIKINFVLERSAIGNIDVNINLLDEIDYPLIPTIKSLESFILDLEKEGKLI